MKYLHTMVRVTDLDASLQRCDAVLKAKREHRFDHPDADGKRFDVSACLTRPGSRVDSSSSRRPLPMPGPSRTSDP